MNICPTGLNAQQILQWAQYTSNEYLCVHCRERDFTPSLSALWWRVCRSVLAQLTGREAWYRTQTHTHQPTPLAWKDPLSSNISKVKAEQETQTVPFPCLLLCAREGHTRTRTPCDLDFRSYHKGFEGRYPSILYCVTSALQLPPSEWVSEWVRQRDPHLITMATQQDQLPACKVL